MRKQIGKRIGPVPIALVAVLALAAFISAGFLLAYNNVGTVQAQSAECEVKIGTAAEPQPTNTMDEEASDDAIQECHISGTSVVVKLPGDLGTTAADDTVWWVYSQGGRITGGSDEPAIWSPDAPAKDAGVTPPVLDPPDSITSDIRVDIAQADQPASGTVKRKSETITVDPVGGNDTVTLYIYSGATVPAAPMDFDHDDDTGTDGVAQLGPIPDSVTDGSVKYVVTFLGNAVIKDDEGMTQSEVTLDPADLGNTITEATVTVTAKDNNGNALTGFVDVTVEDGDSVVFDNGKKTHSIKLQDLSNLPATIAQDYDAERAKLGMADLKLSGIPRNDDLRIKISAMHDGTEITGYIVRKGDAVTVEATAYLCEEDDDEVVIDLGEDGEAGGTGVDADTEGVTNATICNSEIRALTTTKTSDDPDEAGALGPDAIFFISAVAKDSAGNKVSTGNTLNWKLTENADNEDDAKKALESSTGGDRGKTDTAILVSSGNDAVPGTYSITVTSSDREASTMLDITVSDVASQLMISCEPEMISTDTGLTDCTITVSDSNGNVPSNLAMDNDGKVTSKARVAVRSRDVTLIGPNDANEVVLDSDGMAAFSILLREDAPEGSQITVNVSSTIGTASLQASTTVVYGEAQPEMMAPGMPMNVMAEATSHDMITVSWESPADDGGSDITGYMVQSAYMMSDGMMSDWMDVDPAHMGMDMMYMDMGLMAETTYYYRVVAMNSVGMGEYSDGMAMAMTMMMPSMELGAPSITSVMSDADGMATVMLMPGDNATKHYIWAYPVGGPQGMYSGEAAGDADMVTISGLTSGMNYWFIAIAGRGTGTDSEWSAWSSWTAETPVQ